MPRYNLAEPLFRPKQPDITLQDLCGLLKIHWRIGDITIFRNYYTRLDQSYMIWGVTLAILFATAQFSPIPWTTQAIIGSALSLGVIGIMVALTWYWSYVEELRWLIWAWVSLMVLGLAITDYSIFTHWGIVMGHLCHLWLGLSAIGYGITGLSLKSRAFLFFGFVHSLSCFVLAYVLSWQFIFTGLIMAISLFVLGEYQWDMRLPIDFKRLSSAQKQFNLDVYQRSQAPALPKR